ncbi:biopolymer transporter ExbD [Shewanella eurypsychrophilus]|uniref:Biopolymer transporter ExbD n=1 Tax=Shewanella eurypsychrophilus TaxID=2593656 RepID=A0ABX6V568_9GAMM|nr:MULTISPECIES: biopolymer transporter ExbD [Shewanella]QFU22189.1 hypothetical protein FS418_10070 [Shewanella sp. YLB-09]QPG57475.1 biopolymer transporter ExbD [Shewanella eurypsychrophilus]
MKINSSVSHRPAIEPMLSLINVVFLLLIFFLVVGHISADDHGDLQLLETRHQDVEIDIPSDDWLYVTLSGQCIYHEKTVTLAQFKDHFKPAQAIYIAVDASLTMDKLNDVITRLKQNKITKLSLITRLEEK